MKLAMVLLEKLTAEEIHMLCKAYDDGSLEITMVNFLLPKDVKNYPESYSYKET